MKGLGVGILAVAIAAFGWMKSVGLSRRVRLLEAGELLCRRVGEEVRLTCAPPADILALLSKSECARWLPFLSAFCGVSSASFHAVWQREIAAFAAKNGLDDEDAALFFAFGAALGTTDLEGQQQLCDAFATRFSRRRQEAARVYGEKGRLYASLGGIGGLAAALILI